MASGPPLADTAGAYVTVTFSVDGAALAIAGNKDSVQLWNVTNPAAPRPVGKPLTPSAEPAMIVNAEPGMPALLALAGAIVITGTTSGVTQLWDTNVNDAINRICALPGLRSEPPTWVGAWAEGWRGGVLAYPVRHGDRCCRGRRGRS